LYPYTIGGAERWYRSLAERLARDDHEVTYLTLGQWEPGTDPVVPGVRVVAVAPRMALYGANGSRRILPPLVFGLGVLGHLFLRGRRYDAVHTASFPYFSVLAVAIARPLHRFRVLVDWHEVWTPEYWREYLGRLGGWVGWAVQRLCIRVGHHAFCFSQLNVERLRHQGLRSEPERLAGLYAGPRRARETVVAEPVVLFAGRHIPEKRVPVLVPALALAREEAPELRGAFIGDGPDRSAVLRAIAKHGLEGAVSAPGFVEPDVLERTMRRALCLVLPSRREGYGLVVVEAAAAGTPSIVARAPDSAASELIEDGENGFVAESVEPEALAEAILRVRDEGQALRERTAAWFRRNADQLSLERSLDGVSASYAGRGALPAPAQAEDGKEEGGEENLDADDRERGADDGKPFLRQAPEAPIDPRGHDDAA
jgi:glycosyltransferase involved in cell wall biosynthesis